MLSDEHRHPYDLEPIAVLCTWRHNPKTNIRQAHLLPAHSSKPAVILDASDPLIVRANTSYVVIPRWYAKNKELLADNELLEVVHKPFCSLYLASLAKEQGNANSNS